MFELSKFQIFVDKHFKITLDIAIQLVSYSILQLFSNKKNFQTSEV